MELSHLIQLLEVCVVDVLEDQSRSSTDWILHDSVQGDHICSTSQVLQDFNFPLDLLFLDGFECLDHTLLIVCDVKTLEHFTVLAPAQLPHQLEVVLQEFMYNVDKRQQLPGCPTPPHGPRSPSTPEVFKVNKQ